MLWQLLVALSLATLQGGTARMRPVLMFAYFRTPAEALHLAYSDDLFHWTALNDNQPVYRTPFAHSTIRDPFIRKGPDGWFYLIHTGGWTGKSFEVTRSKDLFHWEKAWQAPVMENVSDCHNVWAPEAVWDPEHDQWLVYWSSIAGGCEDQRLWCATTRDFRQFSSPKVLFYPGYTTIDGTLVSDGQRWFLIYKDERGANQLGTDNKAMRVATSDSLYGPYEPQDGVITDYLTEGPAVFQWAGRWWLAYDYFMEGHYGLSVSDDLLHWQKVTGVEFPPGPRHGTFFYISRGELEVLERGLRP